MYKYKDGKLVKVGTPKKRGQTATAEFDARIAGLEKELADLIAKK